MLLNLPVMLITNTLLQQQLEYSTTSALLVYCIVKSVALDIYYIQKKFYFANTYSVHEKFRRPHNSRTVDFLRLQSALFS